MDVYIYKPLAAPLRVLLIIVGTVSLGIGLLALFVPGLPTTEFVILAAACYLRGSERLHRWLTSKPYLQPHFAVAQRFKEKRELPLRVKLIAVAASWLSFAWLFWSAPRAPFWVKWLVLALAIICTAFMWRVKTTPRLEKVRAGYRKDNEDGNKQ